MGTALTETAGSEKNVVFNTSAHPATALEKIVDEVSGKDRHFPHDVTCMFLTIDLFCF